MAEQENKKQDKVSLASKLVSIGKDVVALLRDGSLLLLAVLLIGWPEIFNDTLVRAGFEEGSLVGLKWKAKVSQQDKELVSAQATIADLKAQNVNLEKALNEAKAQLSDGLLKSKITALEKVNAQVLPSISKVQDSLRTTIEANTAFVQKLQVSGGTMATWAVVFSGDTTLKEARYETEKAAPKLGVKDAAIYYRQGSYRGVVIATDRGQANQILMKLKKRRADAYIVNMSTWCPQVSEEKGYVECSISN